mmetsp:Transcript_24331/g.45300  ORF Transcript_24331/g.45300 Transcript_24331/m.45300 type:complete len:203 (+) Transcript_24331:1995-2603(+)
MSFSAAMGFSPIAKITSAEKNAANSSEIKGIRTMSAHLGILSIGGNLLLCGVIAAVAIGHSGGVGDPGHQQAQLFFVGVCGVAFAGDMAVKHHNHPVSQRQNFFQFHRHQQDRFALIAQVHNLLVDEFNRANVHATGRLPDQQKVRVALDLTRQNDLLLVAAGEIFGGQFRIRRAHVKALHLGFGFGVDGFVVHQQAVLDFR